MGNIVSGLPKREQNNSDPTVPHATGTMNKKKRYYYYDLTQKK